MLMFESELTPEQYEFVTTHDGPVLGIAGPGSGKTRALTYRIAHLIASGGQPSQILALTFTRNAANEMASRMAGLVDTTEGLTIGTFHRLAVQILVKHGPAIGVKHVSLAGQGGSLDLIKSLRGNLNLSASDKFPKSQAILSLISRAKNAETDLFSLLERSAIAHQHISPVMDIAKGYESEKTRMGLMDYDDLLLSLRTLFWEKSFLARKYSREWKYIMVDEYQDTNTIQADIAMLLACEHDNLMVVGDDCQSIYGFRGASIQNILKFKEKYPLAKEIHLSQNFRSNPAIVEICNAIIDHATEKLEKTLVSVQSDHQIPAMLYPAPTEQHQADWVVRCIQKLLKKGVPHSEIAVLARNSFHVNLIEMACLKYRVPFVKYGGTAFTETAHIRDILSFFRILSNPNDEMSWHRLLTMLPGLGAKTAEKLFAELQPVFPKSHGQEAVFGALREEEEETLCEAIYWQLGGRTGKQKYIAALDRLGETFYACNKVESPVTVFETFWTYYEPFFEQLYGEQDKEYRLSGVQQLRQVAEQFNTIDGFIQSVSVDAPEEDRHAQSITLSTIHSAKGMEWQAVFVVELLEGACPSLKSQNIEEELRLFYVAVSRAKQYLYLTYPKQVKGYGGMERSTPSRFLKMLPKHRIRAIQAQQPQQDRRHYEMSRLSRRQAAYAI